MCRRQPQNNCTSNDWNGIRWWRTDLERVGIQESARYGPFGSPDYYEISNFIREITVLGPILRGEKISLEPARAEFLPDFIRWFADPVVTRYLLIICPPSEDQEAEWFHQTSRDPNTVHWTIVREERPIGVSGIHNIDWINRSAITGTMIGLPSEWGKGYASEGVRLRTRFAFDQLGLERLETHSFEENGGMHKALERSGYRRIGTSRKSMYRGGQWHNTVLFELLREDWKGLE